MITEATKERLRELEGQRITIEDELDHLQFTNNLARIVKLEHELDEIKDSIKKITASHTFEDISREELQKESRILQ